MSTYALHQLYFTYEAFLKLFHTIHSHSPDLVNIASDPLPRDGEEAGRTAHSRHTGRHPQ